MCNALDDRQRIQPSKVGCVHQSSLTAYAAYLEACKQHLQRQGKTYARCFVERCAVWYFPYKLRTITELSADTG